MTGQLDRSGHTPGRRAPPGARHLADVPPHLPRRPRPHRALHPPRAMSRAHARILLASLVALGCGIAAAVVAIDVLRTVLAADERSARREQEAAVRSNVAADLEHDLRAGPQSQGARIAPTLAPLTYTETRPWNDRSRSRPRRRPQARKRATERLAGPRSRRCRSDRASTRGRGSRPRRRDPACGALPRPRSQPGRSRRAARANNSTCTRGPCIERRRAAGVVRSGSLGETGDSGARFPPASARRPRRCGKTRRRALWRPSPSGYCSRKGARHPLSRRLRSRAPGSSRRSARADGDPASDYLIGQQVFLGYDAKIPPARSESSSPRSPRRTRTVSRSRSP